jgi:hypothetical protein
MIEPTDIEVEAVALAAWLSMTRDPEGPQEWWNEDMWEEWNAPLLQWKETPEICTHIGADGFRRAARAAIIALDEVRGK